MSDQPGHVRPRPATGQRGCVGFYEGRNLAGLYVLSNSTGDDELADCIQKKIRRWKFPTDGVDGDISWPFVFKAKQG